MDRWNAEEALGVWRRNGNYNALCHRGALVFPLRLIVAVAKSCIFLESAFGRVGLAFSQTCCPFACSRLFGSCSGLSFFLCFRLLLAVIKTHLFSLFWVTAVICNHPVLSPRFVLWWRRLRSDIQYVVDCARTWCSEHRFVFGGPMPCQMLSR